MAIHSRGSGSPSWMFPDVGPAELSEAITPYVDAGGNIEFVSSSLIVVSGDHLALLDTGPASVPGSGPSSIDAALEREGFGPRDVDTVVISHGHDDHVGGLTDGYVTGPVIAFPDARHFVADTEFRHWTAGSGRGQLASEKLTAIDEAGTLTLVDGPWEVISISWSEPPRGITSSWHPTSHHRGGFDPPAASAGSLRLHRLTEGGQTQNGRRAAPVRRGRGERRRRSTQRLATRRHAAR